MRSFKLGAALLSVVGLMGCNAGAPRTYVVSIDTQPLQAGTLPEACASVPEFARMSTTVNGARAAFTWEVWEGAEGHRYLDVGELAPFLEPANPPGAIDTALLDVSVIESGANGKDFVSDITKTWTHPDNEHNTITIQNRVTVKFTELGALAEGTLSFESKRICAGDEGFCKEGDSVTCAPGALYFVGREVPVERTAEY